MLLLFGIYNFAITDTDYTFNKSNWSTKFPSSIFHFDYEDIFICIYIYIVRIWSCLVCWLAWQQGSFAIALCSVSYCEMNNIRITCKHWNDAHSSIYSCSAITYNVEKIPHIFVVFFFLHFCSFRFLTFHSVICKLHIVNNMPCPHFQLRLTVKSILLCSVCSHSTAHNVITWRICCVYRLLHWTNILERFLCLFLLTVRRGPKMMVRAAQWPQSGHTWLITASCSHTTNYLLQEGQKEWSARAHKREENREKEQHKWILHTLHW